MTSETSSVATVGMPVYEALAMRLRRAIQDGDFKPGQLIGSEYGLSRSERISRMTVRRASEVLLNEGLVERRPGKGLYVRAGRPATRTVQFVAGNLHWEPSLRISRGAQQAGRDEGLSLQLYDAHGDLDLDLRMLNQLPESGMSGAIVLSLHSMAFNESLFRLKLRGFPFVLVDQRLQEIGVSSVTADNYAGGMQVGQLLLGLGHRRIAFIGDMVATTVRDRFAGLRDAVADAGIPFDRTLALDLQVEHTRLDDWSERVMECVRDAMKRPQPPTALFCSCDAFARAAYRSLAEVGLEVPRDVSVVGFDDDPLAEWLTPALTTVQQPFAAMGQTAMELLRELMENPRRPAEGRTLPVALVQRASTGPARNGS